MCKSTCVRPFTQQAARPAARRSPACKPHDVRRNADATLPAGDAPGQRAAPCAAAAMLRGAQAAGLAVLAWFAHQQAAAAVFLEAQGQDVAREALRKTMRYAAVLPLAALNTTVRDSSGLFQLLNLAVYRFVNVYLFILFVRCALQPSH